MVMVAFGPELQTKVLEDVKAQEGAFNQEKALVGAFSVIVQPVVEPMDRFAALIETLDKMTPYPSMM